MAKKYSSVNKPSAPAKQVAELPSPSLGWIGILITIVFIFILSLAGSMDNVVEKWTGLVSAAILLVLLLFYRKAPALKEYITPLFYSVFAYILWGGISTFYAASSKFAIFEFSKLLVALCVYMVALFFTSPDQVGFKKISLILASTGCFFGIISVDAASSGFLANIFRSILGIFTQNYSQTGIFEQGVRITSIMGNPNTYAGFMALSVILSLYLAHHASSKKESIIATSLLALNALSYLLAFSMGSLFMFFIACLVMLWSTEKGARIALFLLMLETAILAFLFAFISMLGLGKTGSVSFLPILALILNAACLSLIDLRMRASLSEKLNSNIKLLLSTVLIILVLVVGYSLAALTISGDMPLSANESIMRGIDIPAGEYTLQVESSAPVSIAVESQNSYDLMRRTSTVLYSGTNEQPISFTVPENTKIVKVNFTSASDNVKVSRAEYAGPKNGSIHLNYPLLPEIVANRIQDLFANENLVQRTIFFQDGLKLFSRSPIIGRGLGGFENGVYSVQDFYYETKYTHNHYIQALSDLGIIGLALFLSMLLFSVISLIKAKKTSRSLYAVPALAACIVQMFGQALVDATWSTGAFLGFAAAILALITIFCAEPFRLKESFNKDLLRIANKVVLVAFTGIFVLLLSGNLYAQTHAKAGVKDFDEIEKLITIDRFESNDYKLSYIVNAPQTGSEKIIDQAKVYADQLAKVESNSLTPYIMSFYFGINYDTDAVDIAKAGIKNNKSNPNMWMQIFNVLEDNFDPVGPNVDAAAERLRKPKYEVNSVVDIYNMLVERNKKSLDDITLSPANNAFIGKMLEIKTTNLYSMDWAFTAVMTYAFDSDCAVDANHDGLPDNLIVLSGSAKRLDNGKIAVSDNTTIELDLYHKLHGNYTLDIDTETPQQNISVALNDAAQTVQYDKNHALAKMYLEDNSDRVISKFTVTFPTAAEIKNISFTTKLEK